MEESRVILLNRIKTPDGTILTSQHVHDCQTHTDENGLEYMVDGGNEYLRRNVHNHISMYNGLRVSFLKSLGLDVNDPLVYKELSLFSDDSIEDLREGLERGGRGIDGRGELTFVKICNINDNWLENLITYETENRPYNRFLAVYKREQDYRVANNIKVEGE